MDAEEFTEYLRWLQETKVEQLTMAEASAWITALRPLPKATIIEAKAVDVNPVSRAVRVEFETTRGDDGKERKSGKLVLPDGRAVLEGSYGVDTTDDERFKNNTSFFKVWINEDYGKGWGVKLYTSDYTHRVALATPTQIDAIVWIADDPLGAAKLFGLEFKRCGICGRGLTNDESRAAGIGPICAGRIAR
jgi:hypothetical protein